MKESDIKILLDNLVVIVDTREKVNDHILAYLSLKTGFIREKLDFGDYSCYIECNEATKHIINDNIYLQNVIAIERKNSLDELIGSLKHKERFWNEFKRASDNNSHLTMFVEDANGYENMVMGNYKSDFKPKALTFLLEKLEHDFRFETKFVPKRLIGLFIYAKLRTYAKNYLRSVENV